MFDHQLNYVVMFSLVGLGSFVFGVDLLVFGFGPVFWKLSYSPYAKFDQLRYQESGIESIFTGKIDNFSNIYSLKSTHKY